MTVLVDDLGVHEGDRAGPGPPAIMDNLGNRAYTTALLRGHPFSIVDWPLHETRMERSLQIMASDRGEEIFDPSSVSAIMDVVRKRVASATERYMLLHSRESIGPCKSVVIPDAMVFVCMPLQGPLQGQDTAHLPSNDGAPSTSAMDRRDGVVVCCKPYKTPAPEVPIQVAVLGPPRRASVAQAKYTLWMTERREIEAVKPAEASEALLCDHEGGITEGLVTNFCVVIDRQDGQGSSLMTAGPSHPALPGIMLSRVLLACQSQGIKVDLRPPQSSERGFWTEAFLTNCLRGIQPVSRVFCPEGNLCGQPPWSQDLPHALGPVTRQLQGQISAIQIYTDPRTLSRDMTIVI